MLTFERAVDIALALANRKQAICSSVCFNPDAKVFSAYFYTDCCASWVSIDADWTFSDLLAQYGTNLHETENEEEESHGR